MTDNTPFFILGSVRSGTTMLRNLLRLHPRLESPEETHFFRWADPFGTERYNRHYIGSKLFDKHRELDGVDNFDFFYCLKHLPDRKTMMDWYGHECLRLSSNPEGRWFDKTPQNVYGVLLLSEVYPDAKYLHIYRNPLNVVASAVQGAVMPEQELRAGINYWLESMMIINQFRKIAGDRLLEVKYEDLVSDPKPFLTDMLNFLGEDVAIMPFKEVKTHREKNKYRKVLNKEQIDEVLAKTEHYRREYGYADD